jgi:hypothetical protein
LATIFAGSDSGDSIGADDHDRGGTAASGIILGWKAVRIDDDLAEFEQIWREPRYRSPF